MTTMRRLAMMVAALAMMLGHAAGDEITENPEVTAPAEDDAILLSDVSNTTNSAFGETSYIEIGTLLGEIINAGLKAPAAETLISTGVLTVTQTYVQVGAESGTADTIDTITKSGAANGDLLVLFPTSGDTITLADGTAGADNLDLGADVVLDSVNETLILRYNGTNWVQLANSANIETVDDTETWIIAASDETSDLTTTGNPKVTFRAPYAFTITGVRASVTTAPTGANLIVDINEGGTTIMTTNKLSIDATEKTSTTAATAAGVTDTAIADDAEITIDIDQIGSSVAGAGLKVYIEHTRD